jgi:hypothetical protein
MMPGMPKRRTHDYVRSGVTTLLLHRRNRAIEFKTFLTKIDDQVPPDLDVHLICNNYATHRAQPSKRGGPPTRVPPAFHPDQFVVAQPGRTLVRACRRRANTDSENGCSPTRWV